MHDYLSIDKKNIWHPFTPLLGSDSPIFIDAAEGVYLKTKDGRNIIDAISSWWVNIHGHSNPYIAQVLADQALKLEHVIFAGFTHEPAIRLSENLLSILPANQCKIFFSDNGSTSVEVALKMAFQYWHNTGVKKENVVAVHGAYHGDTFGSMSVGERGIFTNPFSPYLFKTLYVDFPEHGEEEKAFFQFQNLIDRQQVGVFIFEPLVQAAAGMRMYSAQLLDRMIGYAQSHDVICIADEVFTGFGRTGKIFAVDHLTHKPDIMCLSKGITGGALPLGVTSCSTKILKAFESDDFYKTFFHGHSYTANPLACAAANASFDLLMKDECQQKIKSISAQQAGFCKTLQNHKKIRNARSLGTILAIELKTEEGSSYSNTLRKKIYPHFLGKDILLRPLGNIIYVLPPYVISEKDLDYIYSCIQEFLESI
ncbi:MAG: adenosylmethionine--8-amino-7-oxononanoate transaminase [Bacteroidota bacterium]